MSIIAYYTKFVTNFFSFLAIIPLKFAILPFYLLRYTKLPNFASPPVSLVEYVTRPNLQPVK